MSKLFEYAIIYHPKAQKDASGNDTTPSDVLVKDITSVLATSDKQVSMLAAKSIPSEYDDKLEQVEIVIRPL